MTYETILYEPADGIARITLNRPGEAERDLLADAAGVAGAHSWKPTATRPCTSPRCRARGARSPPDTISSRRAREGMTHAAGHHTMERDIWGLELATQMRMTIWEMHKPVIAGIHGHCLAGGTDVAFLCDVVIAADDAKIGYPPVRALGSPVNHMWTYLVGPHVGEAPAAYRRHDLRR